MLGDALLFRGKVQGPPGSATVGTAKLAVGWPFKMDHATPPGKCWVNHCHWGASVF